MAAFGAILAIIKAIPIIDSWVQKFVGFYVERQIAALKVEIRNAIKKAVEVQDQRDLEKAVGNANAGEPSGLDGVVTRDDLPGVSKSP